MMASCSAAKLLYASISSRDSGFTSLRSLRSTGGQVGRAHPTAGERERVVHQDREPAFGELVGPAHAAIVARRGAPSSSDGARSLIWAILRQPKYLLPP